MALNRGLIIHTILKIAQFSEFSLICIDEIEFPQEELKRQTRPWEVFSQHFSKDKHTCA